MCLHMLHATTIIIIEHQEAMELAIQEPIQLRKEINTVKQMSQTAWRLVCRDSFEKIQEGIKCRLLFPILKVVIYC